MKDADIRTALKADAGPLPAFDEQSLLLPLPLREGAGGGVPGVSGDSHRSIPSPSLSARERNKRIFWLGPIALAACLALAYFADRPVVAPEDLSGSITAVADAARPVAEVASLPMGPYDRNLAALAADSRQLARFVGDQLDVLPAN